VAPTDPRGAIRRLLPWARGVRRELHRHPELANREDWTRERLLEELRRFGLAPRTYEGFHGFVVDLPGPADGPLVALRADMDGLPVQEETGVPFASEVPGLMHACGHDVHMTCLLAAARLWAEGAVPQRGPVRLLFQPAEEEGVEGGAAPMIAHGALERPRPSYVIGQHVEQSLPVGTVALRPGPMMAASDSIDLTVLGHPGHAGYPHQGPDAILVASEIVVGLQALVSRMKSPVEPAVISIGSIHGGTKRNVMPRSVELMGTVRTLSEELRARYSREIPRRCKAIARSLGASVRVKYERGYPALVNDAAVTERVRSALADRWGPSRVRALPAPVMGAEDFARYLERLPGTFWFLGVGTPGREAAPKHTSRFLPDERSLLYGTEALLHATDALQAPGGSGP
jgi:amidohydrolase